MAESASPLRDRRLVSPHTASYHVVA